MGRRFRGIMQRLLSSRQRDATNAPDTDGDLIRRFVESRDQNAFELLVWRHGEMVLGVCQRLLHNDHEAEDAFQAVFLVLAQKAHSIRSGNVAGWLYRIARRVSARSLRGRVPSCELQTAATGTNSNPIEELERTEILDEEIARLPFRLRQPVLICYLAGRSAEEAAREINCPRGTILSRLSSARKILSERLKRRGVELPVVAAVVGYGLRGEQVFATLKAALRFTSNNSLTDPVTLLANGVIKDMIRRTSMHILGLVTVAFGLVGGLNWVVAQGDKKTPVDVPLAQGQERREKADLKKEPADKDEQLKKRMNDLRNELDRVSSVLEDLQKKRVVRRNAIEAGRSDPTQIKDLEIIHDLERELLVEQLRAAMKYAFVLRAELKRLKETVVDDKKVEQSPSVKDVKSANEAVEALKADLLRLDEQHGKQLKHLKAEVDTRRPSPEDERLAEIYLQQEESLLRYSLKLKLRLAGIDVEQLGDPNEKLDRMSKELDAVKEELKRLKK